MSLLIPGLHRAPDPSNDKSKAKSPGGLVDRVYRPGLMDRCANPDCQSGLLHLFRKRSRPVFEDGWTCSAECTEACVTSALRRELTDVPNVRTHHRHRIPLGLLMLEHGWITPEQLRHALAVQKSFPSSRIGELLIRQGATDEAAVTRALALQWSCPVLHPDSHSGCSAAVPRFFVEAFRFLPLRNTAGKLLYIGFEESLDPAFTFAVERMFRLRVESGVVPSSAFRAALKGALQAEFPTVQLAQAASVRAAAHMLARAVERTSPFQSRLVCVHEFVWLRMWCSHDTGSLGNAGSISDAICSVGSL